MSGDRPHVVIIGAGFGGLAAARAFAGRDVAVTLVDQRNYHLFQPLLYQVATAALSPADIARPIRAIFSRQKNVRVVLDRVSGVDSRHRLVHLDRGKALGYSSLILATGAGHSYFGHDEWSRFAPGLKTLDDATAVRRRILLALERAETEEDEIRRRTLLTFVVIGAGPTGVEMAGAIAELARQSVSNDFRHITPHCSRVILVEAGPRLLPAFAEDLSAAARRAIEQLGVEVRLGCPVTEVGPNHVEAGDESIAAGTIIWAAGVRASPAASWLGVESDSAGRVKVDADCRVPGLADVYAIGDTAAFINRDGRPLPAIAPVAKQQGLYVAHAILDRLSERPVRPFHYRDYGMLATIGRSHAIVDIGRIHLTGFAAWLLWSLAHVYFLVGFQSRLSIMAAWLWNYLTFARHARLITGEDGGSFPPAFPAEQEALT